MDIHARSVLYHDALPPLRPITWMPVAWEELPEDLHNTNITLSAPPPHLCLWLWCQCSVGVAGSEFPMISRDSGLQRSMNKSFLGFKGQKFQDLKVSRAKRFQGYQRSRGFRVTREPSLVYQTSTMHSVIVPVPRTVQMIPLCAQLFA